MKLLCHAGRFAIARLAVDSPVPDWARSAFVAITRTDRELSIVAANELVPESCRSERGWRLLEVQGPIELTEVGVLAQITAPLAEAAISLFAISTFDTDYLLVRKADLEAALNVLERAGHGVERLAG